MTHFWLTFWTYLHWSIEFLCEPPFVYITVLLGLNFIASVIRQQPFKKLVWKGTYSIVVLQFLFFPAAIAVAVLGRVDWEQPHFPGPNYWALRAEDLFDLGSLSLGVYWVCKMKGLRWFASSVALLQLWLLAGAGLIAGMSLTGTWL